MNTPPFNCSCSQGDFGRHSITAECELQPVGESHLCCWQKAGGKKKKGIGIFPHYGLFPSLSLQLCLERGSSKHHRMRRPQLMLQARGRQFLSGNPVTDPDSMFVAHKAASFKTVRVSNCKFRSLALLFHYTTHYSFQSN